MDFPLDYEVQCYLTVGHRLCCKAVTLFLVSFKWMLEALCCDVKNTQTEDNRFIPDVAGVGGRQSVDVETEVGHSQVEHKEVTGVPHLLHGEEGHDADGIEEESHHSCRRRGWNITFNKSAALFGVLLCISLNFHAVQLQQQCIGALFFTSWQLRVESLCSSSANLF